MAVDGKKLAEWTSWSLQYSLDARKWYGLQGESLKKLPTGMDPRSVEKLRKDVALSFHLQDQFVSHLQKLITAEDFSRHKDKLVDLARLSHNAEKNDGGSMAAMAELILGRAGDDQHLMPEFLQSAPVLIERWQEKDKLWKATGQLFRQNRPGTESDQTTSGWMLLALRTLDLSSPSLQHCQKSALDAFLT